jgi:hypothetical protein
MLETRTRCGRLTVVAAAITVGLLAYRPVAAQDPGTRLGRDAVDKKSLRHIQARVAGIDPLHNTLTLRDASGEMAVFELGPDISDVDKFQPGDTVSITYRNAILTRLSKIASSGIRERIETQVMQPASNGEVSSTRSVEFVATVLKIDRKNREVTLRGPTQTQELDAGPAISLDGLRVGDTVRAEFASAVAASVVRVRIAPQ